MPDEPSLILASTSPYRNELLQRLQLPFRQIAPDFTEKVSPDCTAESLVEHNTLGKVHAVLERFPAASVIASDQIAMFETELIGKPGSMENAIHQLTRFSGHAVDFLTGISLCSATDQHFAIVPTRVYFRSLSQQEIVTYAEEERPFDCAGSFKSEALGITLFERIETTDPTALIGLPLIRLSDWLQPLTQLERPS